MMKGKKLVVSLMAIFSAFLLVSCSVRDTVNDIESDVRQEVSKNDFDDLGIKYVIEQGNGENLDAPFSKFNGEIYILSDKENLNIVKKSDFYLNDYSFSDINTELSEDFNIRYNNKTYFTVKKIKIDSNNIKSFKYNSSYSKDILLAYKTTKETELAN